MFNTLTYMRQLEDAGVSRQQAEAHAQALADVVQNEIATKSDLKELEYRLILKLSAIMGTMIAVLGIVTNLSHR